MTARVWVGLIAAGGLAAVVGGGTLAHAIHASTDAPLSIAPEDVQRYRDAGEEVVVIDLRPPDAFAAGHLPRAKSLPLGEVRASYWPVIVISVSTRCRRRTCRQRRGRR